MTDVKLYWQSYKLFPYEKKLGIKEVKSLLKPAIVTFDNNSVMAIGCQSISRIKDLVYFSYYSTDRESLCPTTQFKREQNKGKKQNTRYFSHGIHEYKGKFNPQIVRALLNIFGIAHDDIVLDPFCGSGTTLLECQLQDVSSYGIDINPMATFISRVKTNLIYSIPEIKSFDIDAFLSKVDKLTDKLILPTDERTLYLSKWFVPSILKTIESLRIIASKEPNETLKNLLLLLSSNLLRDYSEQEPSDLRIRRRKSEYPSIPFIDEFKRNFFDLRKKILSFPLSEKDCYSKAVIINSSINEVNNNDIPPVDFVITSPPYATALPYIDTQRLSIVWLGLDSPKNIKELECSLIGCREAMSKREMEQFYFSMVHNMAQLPESVSSLCTNLYHELTEKDGFRKKYTPIMLYKYFSQMSSMFTSIHSLMKADAYYCLVVGYNKTSIGGNKIIDTPHLLADIASTRGFSVVNIFHLETYQRYGIHMENAINGEDLIILKA